MKVMIVGGEQHGQWMEALDGAQTWVNIRKGETFRIRNLNCPVQDLRTGEITEMFVLRIAVHPDLLGPHEPTIVMQIIQSMASAEFARKYGEKVEVPDTPAALIVPDQSGGRPA